MWYILFSYFFRILALDNIAKILTTGPRLARFMNSGEVTKARFTGVLASMYLYLCASDSYSLLTKYDSV